MSPEYARGILRDIARVRHGIRMCKRARGRVSTTVADKAGIKAEIDRLRAELGRLRARAY